MAERRMLSKNLILFDGLADLPHTTQLLYIYLNMQADDDGFVGNPRPVCFMLECDESHLQLLLDRGYLLQFDGGMVVIRHWRVHNQIRKDRYKPTRFLEERARLSVDESGCYQLSGEPGCHLVANLATQDRIDKPSSVQSSPVQSSAGEANHRDATVAPGVEDYYSSLTDFEKEVYSLYQQACPALKPCNYLSKKTRLSIKKLQDLGWTLETLSTAFQKAQQTPFLTGQNKLSWQADMDWLCVDDNLRKVLDGKYMNTLEPVKSQPIYGCSGELGAAELEALQKLLADESL